ncbi:protransforming growth factor alpha isoform X2 [Gouania willdenowi]|uniref:Protransforming growth factor alpha-like n=1 Tax=Gouania willdenowi TaxID=441366 RepID=A0A8C5NCU9_GOUWI|nr:uncharacterized protein LOC114463756 isoform X2 [Gouania willdenowi]
MTDVSVSLRPGPQGVTMTRIFWDTVLLICSSLFTCGAGQSSSTIIEANISIKPNSTSASTTSSSVTPSSRGTISTRLHSKINSPVVKRTFFTPETEPMHTTIMDASIFINATAVFHASTSSPTTSSSSTITVSSLSAHTTNSYPVKKFVAAAVRSHFNDCPDSHQHFCFHGTCRFVILEETPACVCHPGFVGMRCEHADLLAVVATKHRQQTVAKVLVLCVISCVLVMLLCTLLHCWWRQDCRRRRHTHRYITEKHGVTWHPSESVV